MISRHSVLFAATALMLVGGCQSASTAPARVAIAPRPAPEDGYLDQGPHFQTPDQIKNTLDKYAGALPGNGGLAANDEPLSSDSVKLTDPPATPPLEKTSVSQLPGPLYAPRRPITPNVQDPQYTRSNSQSAPAYTAPAYTAPTYTAPTYTAPTYAAPTKTIAPDPSQIARAQTLASAANAQAPVGEPDNIPPESDGPKPAAGRIAPDPVAGSTESLEDRLRRQAHEYPRDPLAQLDWELYCTLKDDPTGGFTGVAMLPDTDRELVSALVDGVRNFRSCLRTNPDPMFTGKIGPLLAMSDVIRSQAELDIPLVAICRSVEKFGNYETMDGMHFPSGSKSKFIVYCEIENFVPQMDAKRMYQTRLVQQVEIFSDSGTEVWSDQSREVDDLCRRQRRDFFLYDIVTLPPNLPPGRYTVKVTVTDVNAKKFTQNVAEIGIVGATEQPAKTPIPVSPSGPLWPFPTGTSAGTGAQYEPVIPR